MPVSAASSTVVWESAVTAAYRTVMGSTPVEQTFRPNTAIGLLDRKRKTFQGGKYLQVPIGFVGTTRAKAIERAGTVAVSDSDDVTMAEYQRAHYYQPIAIYDTEERDCDTPEKVYDLYKRKFSAAKMELNNKLATDFWLSTYTAPQIQGIRLAAPTDGGTSTVYANVPVANTNWASQTNTTGGAASTALLGYLDTLDYSLSAGGSEQWSYAVTTSNIHRILKQVARTYHQFQVNPQSKAGKRIADLGYQVVEYNGRPIVWDINCPAGFVYFFHERACYLAVSDDTGASMGDVDSQGNGLEYELMRWSDMTPNNQVGRATYLHWCGQFVVEERRLIGQISGLTES